MEVAAAAQPAPPSASSSAAPKSTFSAADEPRVCIQCGATSTPLWRNGPAGAKTLCNACGVKLQRHYNRERALRAMQNEQAEAALAAPDTPTHSAEAACVSGGSHSGSDGANQQGAALQRSRSGSQDGQESATSSRGRPLRTIASRLRLTRSRVPRNPENPGSDASHSHSHSYSNRSGSRSRSRHDASFSGSGKPPMAPISPARPAGLAAPVALPMVPERSSKSVEVPPAAAAAEALKVEPCLAQLGMQQHASVARSGPPQQQCAAVPRAMPLPLASPPVVHATSSGRGRARVDGLQLVLPGPNGANMCLNNVMAVLQPQQQGAQSPLGSLSQQAMLATAGPALRVIGSDGACLAFAAAPPPGGPASVAAWRSASPQSVAWNSGYGWSLLFLRHVDYLAFKELLATWHAERTAAAVALLGPPQITVPVKRERSPPVAQSLSPAKQRSAGAAGGSLPMTALQQAMAQNGSLNADAHVGAPKRPRSAGVPIPSSRAASTHAILVSPKRSRCSSKTTVTRVPPLQNGGQGFMRFGSLAETRPVSAAMTGPFSMGFGACEPGLGSAPAALELLHSPDLHDGPLSPLEFEMMESMAGSGGGSSATAFNGGMLAASSCAGVDVQESADSAVHGGSAAGSLLDRSSSGLLMQQHAADRRSAPPQRTGSAADKAGDAVSAYLRNLVGGTAQPQQVPASRGGGLLSQGLSQSMGMYQQYQKYQAASWDAVQLQSSLDGLSSPPAEKSHGSTATGFSGLSARFDSLHVAGSPGGIDELRRHLSHQSSAGLDAAFSDGSAEASMRGGVPRLSSTPSFGSMPMLSCSAPTQLPCSGFPKMMQRAPHASDAVVHTGFAVTALPEGGSLGDPPLKLPSEELVLAAHSPESFHALSVLDELDAGDVDPLDPRFLEQLLDPSPHGSDDAVRGGCAAADLLGGEDLSHGSIALTIPQDLSDGSTPEQPRPVRCNSMPAVCDLQEQQFSFVAAQSVGRSMAGRIRQQASKPPLPPPSPGKANGGGSRSPKTLRRSASAKANYHTGFPLSPPINSVPMTGPPASQSQSFSPSLLAVTDRPCFKLPLSADDSQPAADAALDNHNHSEMLQSHVFEDQDYACDADGASPLDQLLMYPDLMSIDHPALPESLLQL